MKWYSRTVVPANNRRLSLLLVLCACACSEGDPEKAGADAGAGADASASCSVANLEPVWLRAYQEEVVAKLSGTADISPSLRLSDRATPARRQAAQTYLEAEFLAMGYQPQVQDYGNGNNVFVELEGSAETLIVLGAHFDSVVDSPGANDNATGVAAVLAAARFLREQDCRVHSVVFVLFDQEELGLIGSAAFAEKLAFDGQELQGVYTLDQLGWDSDQDRRLEIELPAANMFAQMQATIDRHSLPVSITETSTMGSDHSSFRARGFPALGITEEFAGGDTTPHYHLPGDTYETVDFAFLADVTTLIHGLVLDLSRDL